MKKICILLLVLLLLTGCSVSGGEETSAVPETEMPTLEIVPEGDFTIPGVPETATMPPISTMPQIMPGLKESGDALAFENPGKVRLAYTGDRRSVRYVTSVEELPAEEALEGYDEAFFESKALLLLVETVSNGSVQLEIESITLRGDTATVKLNRTMQGDVGTSDMATWLLWAEVSRELDYNWVLEGGTNRPTGDIA